MTTTNQAGTRDHAHQAGTRDHVCRDPSRPLAPSSFQSFSNLPPPPSSPSSLIMPSSHVSIQKGIVFVLTPVYAPVCRLGEPAPISYYFYCLASQHLFPIQHPRPWQEWPHNQVDPPARESSGERKCAPLHTHVFFFLKPRAPGRPLPSHIADTTTTPTTMTTTDH